jgi:hypothetical protein
MKVTEIKNQNGKLIGYVNTFKAPKFTGCSKNYSATDLNGKHYMSQSTFEQAKAFLS